MALRPDSSYTRALVRGVRDFARPNLPWLFHIVSPSPAAIRAIARWNPHGIIAHTGDRFQERAVMALGKPAVNASNVLMNPRLPWTGVDDGAIGIIAAEHLLERGFERFAFVGFKDARFSIVREDSFRQAVEARGRSASSYLYRVTATDSASDDWPAVEAALARWLGALAKPVGVFACNDSSASNVADVCRQLGLAVPEQVAIIGADDDDLLCEMASPPLSSIPVPARKIGFHAAQLLDRLMAGRALPRSTVLVPPNQPVTRQSTNILAIQDPDVADALRFIREHAVEPIGTREVARAVAMARRTLEKRFRQLLGRSPHDEIRRIRIDRAKSLLDGSSLSMPVVASRCGFLNPQRLAVVFKQATGMTPRSYRDQFRAVRA